jgi:hypothetical protein
LYALNYLNKDPFINYTTNTMVKLSASTSSSTTASKQPSVSVDVVAPILVVEKPPRKVSSKKASKIPVVSADVSSVSEVTTPVVVDEVVVSLDEPVAVPEVAVVVDVSVASKMSNFGSKLQQLTTLLSSMKSEFKILDKNVSRELKAALKISCRKNKRSGNRQPSGFTRATLISDELAIFLDKPIGTELARTTVSKEINQYIRTHSLQDKLNGRQINADEKLSTLLRLQPDDVLNYFNLQRFMKPHFAKVTDATAVSVAATVATESLSVPAVSV